ncbi:hypothetical protein HJFPF1_07278 [Paramyrothecium foliicola]|nr:hypothetical protein HJFPF1_07278 [Paramyrothecium foliicola]
MSLQQITSNESAASTPRRASRSTFMLSDDDRVVGNADDDRFDTHVYNPSVLGSAANEGNNANDTSSSHERPTTAEELKDEYVIPLAYRNTRLDPFTILTDLAATIVPLAIIGILVAIWRLDNAPVRDFHLDAWKNVITVLATTYPIIFASITGRMTSAAAQWRLERGVSVRSAEILHGSRTVGGTLLTLFQLRYVNLLGLAMLLLWATSPIGAQAFFRILSTQLQDEFEPTTIRYRSNDSPINMEDFRFSKVFDYLSSFSLTSTYATLLLAPKSQKMSPMDIWGNVKIPFLETENDEVTNLHGTWAAVSDVATDIPYSSLYGLPVETGERLGNLTFSIETSYIRLQCSDFTVLEPLANITDIRPIRETYWVNRRPEVLNDTWQGCNTSANAENEDRYGGSSIWAIALDRFVDKYWSEQTPSYPEMMANETGLEAYPTQLLFQMPSRMTGPIFFPNSFETICRVRQHYVESQIQCSSFFDSTKNCSVTAQRRSRRQHAPEDVSQLSFPDLFHLLSTELPRLMPGITSRSPGEISIQYLIEPFSASLRETMDAEFYAIDSDVFSIRLSQIINTYLMTRRSFSDEIKEETAAYVKEIQTQRAELVEHAMISRLWIILSLIVSVGLLCSGVSSVVFTHLSDGPEILGYVSTLLRDSRFIDSPERLRWKGGIAFSNEIPTKSIRLGVLASNLDRTSLVGVGETKVIKAFKGQ